MNSNTIEKRIEKKEIIVRDAGIGNDYYPILELANYMESFGIEVFSITMTPNQIWQAWGRATKEIIENFYEKEGMETENE